LTSADLSLRQGEAADPEIGAAAPVAPAVRLLGHVPELDGIRGIAVLMTVVAHSFFAVASGGGVTGVALFFVLSGFLITTLLVQEWDRTGGISLRRFYARRILRLLPALWLVLVVYLVLAFVGFSPVALRDRLKAAFFVATYFGNWQNATGGNLAELSHTWSLAVEDQFYFLWPVALALLLRRQASRRGIIAVTGVAMVVLGVWRSITFGAGWDWNRIYYGTDTVGSSLLIGCLAGLAFSWRFVPERLPRARLLAVACLGLLLLSSVLVNQHVLAGQVYLATIGFPVIAASSALLIISVATDRTAAPWLGHRLLRFFGRISYALYLWHLLTIQVLAKVFHLASLERSVLSIPIAIIIAALSYQYVESAFLRLKRRFEPASTVSVDSRAAPVPA
jgi:peptidoglycan/LPS O-acetylase OafA/YrhL